MPLYRQFLKKEIGELDYKRARPKKRIPVVFSENEAMKILSFLEGDCALMAKLMYGSGLRVSECLRLRIKDIDFDMQQLIIREGKGKKDRISVLT